MTEILRFKLPFAPSVNCLYSGNHRRFKSKRYTAWIREATLCLPCVPMTITGHIEAIYRMNSPDNRRRDIENYAKAISDLITANHIIEDDSNIQRLVMEWADDLSPGIVEVIISAIPADK